MQVYSALKDFLWSPVASRPDDSLDSVFAAAQQLQQRLQQEAQKERALTEQLQQQKQQCRNAMQEDKLAQLLQACQNHKTAQHQIDALLLQQQLTNLRQALEGGSGDEQLVSMLDETLAALQQRASASSGMKQAALDVLPLATVEAHLEELSKQIYALFDKYVGTSFTETPEALADISDEAGVRVEALIKMLQLVARLSSGNDDGPRFARKITDCLSPFIGKFHFHLSVNSAGHMAARINWVFDYTETFLRFITQVWRAVCPPEGAVQLTDQSSIYEVTLRMLCQKVMGLVKIQVANILEELLELHRQAAAGTPPPAAFMELVERSLSADRYVQYLLSSGPTAEVALPVEQLCHIMASRVVDVPNNLTCSVVVCEAPEAMDLFIDTDRESISKKLLESLCAEHSFTTVVQVSIEQHAPRLAARRPTLSCMRGVYDLVWLVRVVSARYAAVSASYRGMVVREVLQPLLWAIPAVLLWWIRSVPDGVKSQVMSIAKKGDVEGMLRLVQMLDTLHFVERALAKEATNDLAIFVHRVKSVWETVQAHATAAANFHAQRARHASQVVVSPSAASRVSTAVSAKPLGVLIRNLFEMSSPQSPAANAPGVAAQSPAAFVGTPTAAGGLLSPSSDTVPLVRYICTLVHALREGVAEELKDAVQQIMFDACKWKDPHRVIDQAYNIAGVIHDCCQQHAASIGDAGQSAVVITTAKVFNQAILKVLVERVGASDDDEEKQKLPSLDIDRLRGVVDMLCGGIFGNALRAEVAQALGESGDAIKLLSDDWSRVSGLWNLLDMEVELSAADKLSFGVGDKDVELGDSMLESPSAASAAAHGSKESLQSSRASTAAHTPAAIAASNGVVTASASLIDQIIADYHARPATSELGGQLPSLASDALKSYGINFLSPRLAHAVLRSRVEPSS